MNEWKDEIYYMYYKMVVLSVIAFVVCHSIQQHLSDHYKHTENMNCDASRILILALILLFVAFDSVRFNYPTIYLARSHSIQTYHTIIYIRYFLQ